MEVAIFADGSGLVVQTERAVVLRKATEPAGICPRIVDTDWSAARPPPGTLKVLQADMHHIVPCHRAARFRTSAFIRAVAAHQVTRLVVIAD